MLERYRATVVQSVVRPVFRKNGIFRPDALRENVDHCCELILNGARLHDSKLFVLPEFCVHGFELHVPTEAWIEASVTLPGPESERLGRVARETGAYVAGMVYEKIKEFPGRYFNTAFIIAPNGEIVLKYRKLYSLTGKTTPIDVYDQYIAHFGGPDALFPVVDTPLGRLGALVCYDINFPEVARCLAFRGAELLLHISSEGGGPEFVGEGGWASARRARAWENTCYLAMANTSRQIDTDIPPGAHHGHSQIVDFTGRVMDAAQGTDECMITAEIDIEALRRRRSEHRFNFLTEVCPQVHLPIMGGLPGWPANNALDVPRAGVKESLRLQLETTKRMRAAGILTAPKE